MQELDWGCKCSHKRGVFGVLLLSDCTYWQHLHEKLLDTLLHLADCNTIILLGHHWRRPEAEQPFFDMAATRFTAAGPGHGCLFVLTNLVLCIAVAHIHASGHRRRRLGWAQARDKTPLSCRGLGGS